MTTRTNKRKDFNEIAVAIGRIATGDATQIEETARVKASRKGGIKGGVARAVKLTPEQRTIIAKKAAMARWKTEETK